MFVASYYAVSRDTRVSCFLYYTHVYFNTKCFLLNLLPVQAGGVLYEWALLCICFYFYFSAVRGVIMNMLAPVLAGEEYKE